MVAKIVPKFTNFAKAKVVHRMKRERERVVFHGDTSLLAEHALRYGHERDWENAKFLDHSDIFVQEYRILQQQDIVMNRECGILPHAYKGLMT